MRQKLGWRAESGVSSLYDGAPEVVGVPVNDGGGEQVQPGHTVVLAFGRTILDFALATNAQGILQGVVSLAFVETNLSAALHVSIEQPVDDEERTLNATDFAQSQGQLVLTRVSADFFSN